jgi:NAD dependent epimerase/dehydratase family enzyme
LLLSGQKVLPKKLLAAGFSFAHPDLESAIRWALAH